MEMSVCPNYKYTGIKISLLLLSLFFFPILHSPSHSILRSTLAFIFLLSPYFLSLCSGFRNCFHSVRVAILQILELLLTSPPLPTTEIKGQQDHWDIVVTGHSLGGALSSLFSFELARMKLGTYGVVRTYQGVSSSTVLCVVVY